MIGPDGPLLAFDTSTPMGSVAVGTAAGIQAELSLTGGSSHSQILLPAIDHVVRSAGLAPTDLRGVVVGSGPGSFTGVRIAGATAKGLTRALGVPLYSFSSLLVLATQASANRGTVCAVFDARGRDVFAAAYTFHPSPRVVFAPTACTLDEMLDRCAGVQSLYFLGDGAIRHRDEIEARFGAVVGAPHAGVPRASGLIWLAETGSGEGLVADTGSWEPTYLRPSGAERIAASRDPHGGSR